MHPTPVRGALAAIAAIGALALLPSVAAATFQGQEGYLVLTHAEGQAPKLVEPKANGEVLFPEELEDAGEFAGSADGQRLAEIAAVGNNLGIKVGNWNGTGMQPVAGGEEADWPAFSPDGELLAFVRGGRVRTIPVAGGTATAVGPTIDSVRELEWSPDGSRILYVTGEDESDIGVLDVATGATTPLTDTADANEDQPSWSPDGTHVVFRQWIEDATTAAVRTMAEDGSDVRTFDGSASRRAAPVYSPTGARIAYLDQGGALVTQPVGGGPTTTIDDSAGTAVAMEWLVKPGTGNHPPAVTLTSNPEFPRTDAPVTFTAAATDPDGMVGSYAWDLDNDGAFDDGTAPTAQTTYTTAGQRTVRVRVRDNLGLAAVATRTVTVVEAGKPVAFFTVAPAKPVTSTDVHFTAAVNDDPAAVVVKHQWDFDGNGTFDADTGAGREATWEYDLPGTYHVKLRTTDADGDQTEHTENVVVARNTQCGVTVGRFLIPGCIEVNGMRGLARDGLTVNGLTLTAPSGTAIIVDRTAQGNAIRAVDADAADRYLDGAGAGPPVDNRPVTVSVCGERIGATALDLRDISDLTRPKSIDVTVAADASIAGLNVTKVGSVAFGPATATMPLEGRFPRIPLTPAASGTYELRNDCNARRLHVKTNDLLFRTVRLTDVDITRVGGGRDMQGTLGVHLPVIGTGVTGTAVISDGAITRLRLSADDLTNIGAGLTLREVSLQLRLRGGDVATVTGGAKVATRGRLFGHDFASTEGYLTVGEGSIRIDGNVNVFDIPVGFGYIEAGLGWIDLGTGIDTHLGPAFVQVEMTGLVSVAPPGFNLEGRGRAGFKGIGSVGAEGLLSTKGIGVCGEFDTAFGTARPGVTAKWLENMAEPRLEDMDFNVFVSGCDLGPIRFSRSARAAAADATRTVAIPARLPSASVQVTGADGPPKVTLVAPNGEKIVTPADDSGRQDGRFILVQDARTKTTSIMIVRPPAGAWKVEPAASSPAIRSVGVAHGLPQPKVVTRVTGKGARRTLRWRLRSIPGQRVRLLESGRHGSRVIATTNRRSGTKRFKPAAGLGGKRRIVAFVEQGGLPRRKLAGARFTVKVPKAARPLRPRSARWTMTANALRVTFRARSKRLDHQVQVVRASGVKRVDLVPAGRSSTVLPGLWAGERVKSVTVRAVASDGRLSAPRVATKETR